MLERAVMKCVTESVFSCRFLLFVKLQTITVNSSDRVCDRICFYKTQTLKMSAMESVFVEASGHYYEWQCPSLWQILLQTLFLV